MSSRSATEIINLTVSPDPLLKTIVDRGRLRDQQEIEKEKNKNKHVLTVSIDEPTVSVAVQEQRQQNPVMTDIQQYQISDNTEISSSPTITPRASTLSDIPADVDYVQESTLELVARVIQLVYDNERAQRGQNQILLCFLQIRPIRWMRRKIFDFTDIAFLQLNNITVDKMLDAIENPNAVAVALVTSGFVQSMTDAEKLGYSKSNVVLNSLLDTPRFDDQN